VTPENTHDMTEGSETDVSSEDGGQRPPPAQGGEIHVVCSGPFGALASCQARERFRTGEHVVEHRRRQPAGESVLLTDMETAQQGRRSRHADLGTMAVVTDPGGAVICIWQPGLHQGFGVLNESGAPCWFELHTRDYQAEVSFYREVFGWDTQVMSDTSEFRYTTLKQGDDWLAGIMDASSFLPDGVPTHWSVYFGAADTDAALARVVDLGGSIVTAAQDTPYGRLATAADLTGAHFKLVQV